MTRIDPLNRPEHRVPSDVLRLQAESVGEKLFLRDAAGDYTYGRVDELADRHATGYGDLGVGDGDTVAFFMENSADLVTTAMGVNRAGAAWSPLPTEYRGEWLSQMLTATRAKVLVTEVDLLPELMRLGKLPFDHVVVKGGDHDAFELPGMNVHDLSSFDDLAPASVKSIDYGDTSAILWTSGTTGPSKGVMQPHAAWTLWPQRHNDVFRGGIREGESFYYCMPMYNSGGWVMSIFPALVSGSTACIDDRFSVTDFWNRVKHWGANHTMTLGAMHVFLFQQPPSELDADNPLRTLVMNPVVPQIMKPFMDRFGIERIGSGYGQSEIMGATFYNSDMANLKPGSCGFTGEEDLVETRVLDDHDEPVGTDVVGEICVRPRVPFSIFSGYYNQPEASVETFRNQWHHTGDLGRFDADGELFFVDRKKDSIRHKGRNTSTFEVEHIARRFPGVIQVGAVGVPSEDIEHEEELMIFLQVADAAAFDPLAFCQFIDENAPYFFVPRFVEVLDAMPMTPTNKLQKFKLRERGLSATSWDRTASASDWAPRRPDKVEKRAAAKAASAAG